MSTILWDELAQLPRPKSEAIAEVRLAASLAGQREFKASVETSLREMEKSQRGRWLLPLLGGNGADVLAFAANSDGVLTGLYASNGLQLGSKPRRLGSQSKLAALLAFAAAGRSADSILCNRAWNGRRNADGHPGYRDCSDPRALVPLQTVLARSLNLPILEELRRIDPAIVAQAARDAGFAAVTDDLPYEIAFGVAEGSPLRVAATAAAISRGVAGEPAVAPVPRAIARYRIGSRWLTPRVETVDLQRYFATAQSRRLLAAAGAAPLRPGDGTLRAIGAAGGRPGEIAKSGTDERDEQTFAKTAVGAMHGASWFTMVAAQRGPVGRQRMNLYPLAETTRGYALQARHPDAPRGGGKRD